MLSKSTETDVAKDNIPLNYMIDSIARCSFHHFLFPSVPQVDKVLFPSLSYARVSLTLAPQMHTFAFFHGQNFDLKYLH